ncbi:MAG: cupin domain-containing protein [Thermodesulfobacteriota bacterium]
MATQSAGPESARATESGRESVRSLPSLAEKIMYRDLAAEQVQLRQEDEWQRMGRNAMTLVKYPDLRVVLTVMRPGSRIERNRDETEGRVAIHVLSGRVRLEVGDQRMEVGAGGLLALDHKTPHDIEALEESAFLIWVSWLEGREGER